jgi:hypothetical protein
MSETGHLKNVANFETLVDYVTNLGSTYNPNREELKLPNLQSIIESSKNSISTMESDFLDLKNKSNLRELTAKTVDSITTRAFNILKAGGAQALTIDDARSIINELKGRRARPLAEPKNPAEAVRTHSVAQTSYDNKAGHFNRFILLISEQSAYSPNEPDLKVSALNTLATDFQTKNNSVMMATNKLSTSRLARNQILYGENTGLVEIALSIKAYLKGVFGVTNPQFKQISGLKFTKPRG